MVCRCLLNTFPTVTGTWLHPRYSIWVSDGWEVLGSPCLDLLLVQACAGPGMQTQPFLWPHLGIIDVVGTPVLGELAERLKPGGIREVRADGAWTRGGVKMSRGMGVEEQRPLVSGKKTRLDARCAALLCERWVVGFSHQPSPHRRAPSRGFHTGPAGRAWGCGSRGLLGAGKWSLPSRLESEAQRSVHIQREKEGCLG